MTTQTVATIDFTKKLSFGSSLLEQVPNDGYVTTYYIIWKSQNNP